MNIGVINITLFNGRHTGWCRSLRVFQLDRRVTEGSTEGSGLCLTHLVCKHTPLVALLQKE